MICLDDTLLNKYDSKNCVVFYSLGQSHFLVSFPLVFEFLFWNQDEPLLFIKYKDEKGKSHESGASMLSRFILREYCV